MTVLTEGTDVFGRGKLGPLRVGVRWKRQPVPAGAFRARARVAIGTVLSMLQADATIGGLCSTRQRRRTHGFEALHFRFIGPPVLPGFGGSMSSMIET